MKKEINFGIGKNGEWEFLGISYVHPDFIEKPKKELSKETLKFCIDISKDYLVKEIEKEKLNFKKFIEKEPERHTKNAKMTSNYASYERKLDLCMATINKYEEFLKEINNYEN